MAEILTASEIWIDSLKPISNSDGLQDVLAVVNIKFIDSDGNTVVITNKTISAIASMNPSELEMIRTVYQSMIDNMKAQYLPQPDPAP